MDLNEIQQRILACIHAQGEESPARTFSTLGDEIWPDLGNPGWNETKRQQIAGTKASIEINLLARMGYVDTNENNGSIHVELTEKGLQAISD
ncbi:MAG: hypothetical protein KKB70_05275 [Proteobacteria bacterium]|nr:hypothetical protein [Pseudomonadota bacterium]